MTRKEALEILKVNPLYSQEWESDYYETVATAFKMAVKSLEAWDKLTDEISSLSIDPVVFDCLRIIDKQLKEIEES